MVFVHFLHALEAFVQFKFAPPLVNKENKMDSQEKMLHQLNDALQKGQAVSFSPEPTEEFVDMQDLSVLMNAQREHQLVSTQTELAAAKIEIIRLKLKIKYNLKDSDTINSSNGLISRS